MKKLFFLITALAFTSMVSYAQSVQGTFETFSGIGNITQLSRNGHYAVSTTATGEYAMAYSWIWSRSAGSFIQTDTPRSRAVTVSNNGIAGGLSIDTAYQNYGQYMITGAVYNDGKWVLTGLGSAGFIETYYGSRVLGMSADGSKAVGYVYINTSETTAGIIWDLTDISSITFVEGEPNTRYYSYSMNGNIIGGCIMDGSKERPALWINGTRRDIALNPADWPAAALTGNGGKGVVDMISSNGKYAAGRITLDGGGFYTGVAFLHDIAKDTTSYIYMDAWKTTWYVYDNLSPVSVTDQGEIVTCMSNSSNTINTPFYWSENTGILTINNCLALKGMQVNGTFSSAVGISADGNVLAGKNWIATAGYVRALIPADSSQGVPLAAEIAVEFNYNVTARNLSGILISPAAGTAAASIVDGRLVITHTETLTPLTEYTVTVPAGTLNDIDEEITWSFTTNFDPANPPVVAFSEDSWYSEDIVYNAVNSKDFTITNTGAAVLTASEVKFIDNSGENISSWFTTTLTTGNIVLRNGESCPFTISIRPDSVLSFNSVFLSVTTNVGPVEIALSGITRSVRATTDPYDGKKHVALDKVITVTFERNVTKAICNYVQPWPVKINGSEAGVTSDVVSANQMKIIYIPGFEPGQEYTVSIMKCILAELAEDYEFSFTATDISPVIPQVVSKTPEDLSGDVSVFSKISVEFDVDITLGAASRIKIEPAVEGISASVEGKVLTISHQNAFAGETEYKVTIEAGAVESINDENTEFDWSFTTGIAPEKPVVQTVSPEGPETALDAEITAVFDLDIVLIDPALITIIPSVEIEDILVSGSELKIKHADFEGGTDYKVVVEEGALAVKGIQDAVNEEFSWEFTTVEAIVNISDAELLNVKVYPNPTAGIIHIESEGTSYVKIADAVGRLVDAFVLNGGTVYKFKGKGVYVLSIEKDGKESKHKVLVR